MREICLDTETTGLEAKGGDRVIEIGCVELSRYGITDNSYHQLINPEREVPEEAVEVHGLTNEILADKPVFADIIDDFIEYVKGTRVIIHNAPFDVGFLDEEFKRLKRPPFSEIVGEVVDSLDLAKRVHPQMRNTLDALCARYNIDNSHRTKHGALLDAELLAQVYLVLRQNQSSFTLESETAETKVESIELDLSALKVIAASPEELDAHEAFLDHMDKKAKSPCNYRKSEDEFAEFRRSEAESLEKGRKKIEEALKNL